MATIKKSIRSVSSLGSVSGAVAIDASKANYFVLTLTGDATFTVSNIDPGEPLFIQVTRSAASATVTWAGQASGVSQQFAALTTQVLTLTGSSQALSTCTVAGISTSGGSSSSGDEVPIEPSGSDDTAAVNAVLQANLVAFLARPGGLYFLGPITLGASLTTAGLAGGIRCARGVEINPIASFAPAAGSATDRNNAWFLVSGQNGAYSSTITVANYRGWNILNNIVTTTGLSAGTYVRAQSSPVAGLTLDVQGFIFRVASVLSGTSVSIDASATLPCLTGSAESTQLPIILRSIVPVRRFFIDGGYWNTLGRNIYSLVTLTDCDARGVDGDLRYVNIKYRGFCGRLIDQQYCHGLVMQELYSNGLNNGAMRASSGHDWKLRGVRSTPFGPAYHTQGSVQCQIIAWCGSSDFEIDDVHMDNVAGVIHHQGGWAARIGDTTVHQPVPSIRYTRDPEAAGFSAIGTVYENSYAPTNRTEVLFGASLGVMKSSEGYYDNSGGAIVVGVGPYALYLHDAYETSIQGIECDQVGNNYAGTLGGNPYVCQGGFMSRDNVGGNVVYERFRNTTIGYACNGLGSNAMHLGQFAYTSTAGVGLGGSTTAMTIDTGGNACVGNFTTVEIAQSASILFGSAFFTSPDYYWRIDHWQSGYQPPFYNVGVAKDPGPVAFLGAEIAKWDRASASGVRQIVVAAANDPAPVIVASGAEIGLSTVKLICFPGGGPNSCTISGVSVPGDLLVAEGGVTHRAIVGAATLVNCLGRVLNGTGATGIGKVTQAS